MKKKRDAAERIAENLVGRSGYWRDKNVFLLSNYLPHDIVERLVRALRGAEKRGWARGFKDGEEFMKGSS